jgi:hypothetical protein
VLLRWSKLSKRSRLKNRSDENVRILEGRLSSRAEIHVLPIDDANANHAQSGRIVQPTYLAVSDCSAGIDCFLLSTQPGITNASLANWTNGLIEGGCL